MVQFAFTATLLQLFVWVKLLFVTPLIATEETVSVPGPLLLKVTGTGVEVVPVIVGGKLTKELERLGLGLFAMPVTESGM
jgi:hypothetical protein